MQKAKVVMDKTTQNNIDSWLEGDYDEASQKEIRRLQQENPEELLDAFYTHLSFGTGGMRGVLGVGTNRINAYTIGAATQGLANYLLKQGGKHSVLVGFDSRHHSRDFAEEVAKVLSANGIEVFLFRELRPVASISYGVRHLKCSAGVMITASHNPPKYNGYKVYWNHGGQVLPPHDRGIIDEVAKISQPSLVKKGVYPHPLIHDVSEEIDTPYLAKLRELQPHPGDDHSHGKELAIVYSPIHGGGITMVPPALEQWGFTNLTFVEEQCTPNGDFPTVKVPNPEEPETLKMGIALLEKTQGDIFIATDPDVDRLAVTVMHNGKPVSFNGNEIACLALEHLCHSLTETKQMPPKPMAIKTIVTSELFKAIADHYQVSCLDVLTGFKYIGQKISQWEEEKPAHVQG
ncbi:MAG: Phosphoglucomutase, partial [Chlamydiae bacterium]|nr:Phosphoglucomutase [Chlamydiota bacterium]